ncbi:MAG: 3-deoxy-D-manno-octulosonic acid transferase [Bacteroidales bacterium]
MESCVYNMSMRMLAGIFWFAALFNKKARLSLRGRKESRHSIKGVFGKADRVVWVHCASLGEFEQGRPIIEKIKEQYPHYKIAVTFFSPSGYEVRKNYELADWIGYIPFDTRSRVEAFVKELNPELVYFVKYEFWHNLIRAAKRHGAKLYLVSGIFRKNQSFFKFYGKWFRESLKCFDKLFVQNEASSKLLKSIRIENCEICGDTRFDRVIQIAERSKDFPLIEEFSQNNKVVIGGSTWPPDEDIISEYFNRKCVDIPDLKVIIAPHEFDSKRIEAIKSRFKGSVCTIDELERNNNTSCRVLIVNCFGMLSSIYKYAFMAHVGGGFGKSIHNLPEAAVYGIPVSFGPRNEKFQEAQALKECGGGIEVSNYVEYEEFMSKVISDYAMYKELCNSSKDYIYRNQGATTKIVSETVH